MMLKVDNQTHFVPILYTLRYIFYKYHKHCAFNVQTQKHHPPAPDIKSTNTHDTPIHIKEQTHITCESKTLIAAICNQRNNLVFL